MAAAVPEDTLQCAICLDVFTNPVTTPCGHNFCRVCINRYWDGRVLSQCPLCKSTFLQRPQLGVNTFISELASQCRKANQAAAAAAAVAPPPFSSSLSESSILCDICPAPKAAAAKSCLACLTSLCPEHLEPHLRVPVLRRHTLVEPVQDLDKRMCTEHNKVKDMYCRMDQTFICHLCWKRSHRGHMAAWVEDACQAAMGERDAMMAELQRRLAARLDRMAEMETEAAAVRTEAEREKAASAEVFAGLVGFIQRSQAELLQVMEERRLAAASWAEAAMARLREEIAEVERRRAALAELDRCEDHHLLLQRFTELSVPLRSWTERMAGDGGGGSDGGKLMSVAQLRQTAALMTQTLAYKMRNLPEVRMRRMRSHAVDVTLDPDTAHRSLVVSHDGKQVRYDAAQLGVHLKERHPHVLARDGFTRGRFYFEVQVGDKVRWEVGVARDTADRRKNHNRGFWTLRLDSGTYTAGEISRVRISLAVPPQTVGVYVDYGEGHVSFVDARLDYCMHTLRFVGFGGKLYPYLCPQDDPAPLTIAPLRQPPTSEATNDVI